MKGKSVLLIGMTASLIAAQPASVFANTGANASTNTSTNIASDASMVSSGDEISTAQSELQQAQQNYEAAQQSVAELESQKQDILNTIDGYDQDLVTTMASIQSTNDQITSKEAQLQKTSDQLHDTEQKLNTQYDAMKKRIQYVYENGSDLGWAGVMLKDDNLSDYMNSVDNTQKMYDYDRSELDAYTKTRQEYTDLQAQEQAEKSSLEATKNELENGKENLEAMKADAEAQGANVDSVLADAQSKSNEYYAVIQEQNQKIADLQAIAAQKAAEKAAKQAAAEQTQPNITAVEQNQPADNESAAQSATNAETQTTVSDEPSVQEQPAATDTDAISEQPTYDEQAAQTDNSSQQTETVQEPSQQTSVSDTSTDQGSTAQAAAPQTSSSGQAVVNYALQFVGNPYVWGGTSLTNGCDCSGFVQQVYANFGIGLSRTTYTQANEGVAVSYDEMQPGDVINYGGHTAIYIGNNQIVHAANENLGIIVQSNPAFEPIVTIRRFV